MGNDNATLEIEFARVLKEIGLDLGGNLPVMDGKVHHVPLLGNREHNGAYLGYSRGVGFVNVDGHILNWQPESGLEEELSPLE
jgi:hypothetical protein